MFKQALIDEIKKEVELSNIRKSSNDDVEYAIDVIDRLIDLIEPYTEKEHYENCGCTYCN